jgi:nucleoside-diphosphate-sugar epimerase
MNILVAGGAGMIGSHLCEQLIMEEHSVICMDNLSTGRIENIRRWLDNPLFTFIQHDLVCGLPSLPHVDRIYHLASPASPPGFTRLPIETLRVNSEGTFHLLELARRDGARLLYSSTSEAYGDPLEHPQREEYRGNVSSIGPRSMYDEAKRFGEAMSVAYMRTHHVDARVVRIFNTYGPHCDPRDGRLVVNFIVQALREQPLTVYGDGRQTRSLCYVSDLIEGLRRAMEANNWPGGVLNLGNPDEHSVLRFAEIIRELTGKSSEIIFTEPAVGDDPQRRRPDITRARALLGWEPQVALHEGLTRTIGYLRTELGLRSTVLRETVEHAKNGTVNGTLNGVVNGTANGVVNGVTNGTAYPHPAVSNTPTGGH